MFCLRLPGWQPFISARRHLPFGFGSPRGILLPNLDFSLAGFTSFHPERFRSGFVTVARYGSASWDRSFRVGLRRQLSLPGLIDSAGTNTTGITACASMDFPLITSNNQRLPEYARLSGFRFRRFRSVS